MAAGLKAQERRRAPSRDIGRDVHKMRDALMREAYDRLDYAGLRAARGRATHGPAIGRIRDLCRMAAADGKG
jgi:hypothetical protein